MSAQPKKVQAIYGVHPGVVMVQKWVSELKEKTGRSLDEWIAFAKKEGPSTERERRDWLKIDHKLGSNSAWWIAARIEGKESEEDSPEKYLAAAPKYVNEQSAGKKELLRPLYEYVLRVAAKLGPEVRACPCRTIVPLYRNHVFAELKPTTNTRLDLGLSLTHYKGKVPKRLVDTGGLAKNDRITHRIELKSKKDTDSDMEKWLKIAYDLDEK